MQAIWKTTQQTRQQVYIGMYNYDGIYFTLAKLFVSFRHSVNDLFLLS